MAKPDAKGWRYTPGLWYRTDGARVERHRHGSRKGVWKAHLPGSQAVSQKMILIDGTVGDPFTKQTPWRGYRYAKLAKHALDTLTINTCRLSTNKKPPPVLRPEAARHVDRR